MTRLFSVKTWGVFALAAVLVATLAVLAPQPAASQATVSAGSIEGTITDPTGAAVPGAKIAVTNKSTGQSLQLIATPTGAYNTGPLLPGSYLVRVEAKGFKTVEIPIVVNLGVVSPGSVALQLGAETTVIQVAEQAVAVNTEQSTVQGVMTSAQIENLPINGRNFLDLAQLEPGVQIQDGGNFDPTKNGFMSISFGGRFGRTARIEVDGVDISDETVGTTTQNFPAIAIQEFQVAQSSLDLSTELTSSGTVNVSTVRGANAFHGETFFSGRSDQTAARFGPKQVDFARKQYGARLGGPFFKDKLFFVGAWERTQQDLEAPVVPLSTVFSGFTGSFNGPFRDNQFLGRLDYTIKPGWSVFYRFSYEQNRDITGFIPNTYQPFGNLDNTPVHAVGFDFSRGRFSHSMRFGFTKFRNAIGDASSVVPPQFNPAPNLSLAIGGSTSCLAAGVDVFCSGPNILAPQKTFQRNIQGKYDGSWTFRSHIVRYGFGINSIKGGGFANFFGLAPAVRSRFSSANIATASTGTITCPNGGTGSGCPLNYPVSRIILGNGQGCFTEEPSFGFACGGQFDTRLQWYVGDSWKMRHNLSITGGLRYVRDTGRSDADLPELTSLDQFQPGLGKPVRQPEKNYGGTLGIAWDPKGSGKTVVRVGTGIYYENAVFNNVLFDRPGRLPTGLFNLEASLCPGGALTLPTGVTVTSINGRDIATQICGQRIGLVANDIAALQALFQQATLQAGPQANGGFFGNALASSPDVTGTTLYAPDYRSPYSWQFNVGVQHQLYPGTVVSADYVRNVNLHYLLAVDVNHVGDARFLDRAGALAAITATNTPLGCAAGTAGIPCAIARGATIADYAGNGLTSGFLGNPGGGPSGAGTVAFPGINPNFGVIQLLEPIGRSVYNAMQVKLVSNPQRPLPKVGNWVKNMTYQVSYSLSRYESQATDTDFINTAVDFGHPSRFIGPNGLDRTHQLSGGAFFDVPLGTRLSIITHWFSNLPQTLVLSASFAPEDIFQTEFTGDGQEAPGGLPGSVLPGTNLGDFGRSIRVSNLNNVINNYNNNIAGKTLTPAGQALVNAGLFTQAQLFALGATPPPVGLAPPGQVGLSSLFTFDFGIGWRLQPSKLWSNVTERLVIEPKITVYNLFNRQNFDGPNAPLGGELNGQTGFVNGTTAATRTNRVGLGTGVFAFGAPRQVEFGAKITF